MTLLFVVPSLPIYTPKRGRIVRGMRCAILIGALALAFGHDATSIRMLFATLWPMAWAE